MVAPRRKKAQVGTSLGFRSGLEGLNASLLKEWGVPVQYEQFKLTYTKPAKTARYTPDFVIPNGIVVETKGHFITADRQKHILIKAQYPHLDVRFVFANPDTFLTGQKVTEFRRWMLKEHGMKLPRTIPQNLRDRYQPDFFATLKTKPSQTTYAKWCDTHGFQYAGEKIPRAWVDEAPTQERMTALVDVLGWTPATQGK